MQLRAVFVVVALVIASVAVGSAAFTSGSVDRTANVDVVGDGSAVTGLQAGSTPVVSTTNGELQIDFSNYASADGVNANASYTVGDTGNANETYAFNITNNGDSSHDYTFSYAFDGSPPSGSSVTFTVYDDTGTQQVEATDSSNSSSLTLNSDETAYVVITVDTTDATKSDDLSGTLTVSAT